MKKNLSTVITLGLTLASLTAFAVPVPVPDDGPGGPGPGDPPSDGAPAGDCQQLWDQLMKFDEQLESLQCFDEDGNLNPSAKGCEEILKQGDAIALTFDEKCADWAPPGGDQGGGPGDNPGDGPGDDQWDEQ